MKKDLLIILFFIITTNITFAHNCYDNHYPKKPSLIHQIKMDNLLNERLNLTKEQQEYLKENRSNNRKEMEKIVKEMKKKHEEIRNIYLTGIPKFQADIKTAPLKAELVILKQNADKLRQKNRKNFESILTKEQKAEFEVLRKELAKNRPHNHAR